MITDTQRIEFLASCERCTTSNKWLVQVIYNNKWTTAYFSKPPQGIPDIIYSTKEEALRAAIDEAMYD